MEKVTFVVVREEEYVTIRHSPDVHLIWNELRGVIPSEPLRDAMMKASEFIVENEVELILADFTKMCAPSLDDQVWIAIQSIYELASRFPLPCEAREFVSREEALEWLFSE